MGTKISVGISNRHVHLTEDIYNLLFDEPLTKKRDLNQPMQFAANQTLTLKTVNGKIDNVRIVGPLREYNQVEISKSDAHILGLNPPVRNSGDLTNASDITLVTKNKEVNLSSVCIIANRHIHISEKQAQELNLSNDDLVDVLIPGEKGAIVKAHIKITKEAYLEMHIDRDDANAFLLNDQDEVIVNL